MITLCKHVPPSVHEMRSASAIGPHEPNTVSFSSREKFRNQKEKGGKSTSPFLITHFIYQTRVQVRDRVRFTILDRVTHVFNTRPICGRIDREALRN